MKEKEREDYDSGHYSNSVSVKKKCKKKRSPVDDDGGRHRHYRSDESDSGRRKEHRTREFHEDLEDRRKDHEYYSDSRRKDRDLDETDHRRREVKKERGYEDADKRRKEKRCNKHKEPRRRDGGDQHAVRVKDEPLSDFEERDRSRSPHREDRKPSNLEALINVKEEKHDWGRGEEREKKKPLENKAKPDFTLSGKLAEETNIVNGVLIKYSEPEEARKPRVRWRLYPFKGDSSLPCLYLHRQSAYLVGRDRKIADLPVDHPSCSKQHAVLQYRLVPYTRLDGSQGKRVRPYIIDLESANGTFVNNKKIEPKKYVELLERDVIKFAFSSREYVLLHENSKEAHLDDDVQ